MSAVNNKLWSFTSLEVHVVCAENVNAPSQTSLIFSFYQVPLMYTRQILGWGQYFSPALLGGPVSQIFWVVEKHSFWAGIRLHMKRRNCLFLFLLSLNRSANSFDRNDEVLSFGIQWHTLGSNVLVWRLPFATVGTSIWVDMSPSSLEKGQVPSCKHMTWKYLYTKTRRKINMKSLCSGIRPWRTRCVCFIWTRTGQLTVMIEMMGNVLVGSCYVHVAWIHGFSW